MMLLTAISLAATIDVDLPVDLLPDPGAGPHKVISSGRGGPTTAPDGRYPGSEPGFTCVVRDGVLHVEFAGNTGAWPDPMPATARCVVGADDVVIHTVEADDRWEEMPGSSTDRAGTLIVFRGVRCAVPPTGPPSIQLWTPSESEFEPAPAPSAATAARATS